MPSVDPALPKAVSAAAPSTPSVPAVRADRELASWLVPVCVVVLLLAVAGGVLVTWPWLKDGLTESRDLATARASLIGFAMAAVAGGVGILVLYLTARRQRTTERDLRLREQDQGLRDRTQAHNEAVAAATQAHQDRVATATEQDAARRAVTEQYGRAVDQLGSDNDTVRLAGLYALERLGQGTPEMRQTVVNVLCAYLRRPFSPPVLEPKLVYRNVLPSTLRRSARARQPHRISLNKIQNEGTKVTDRAIELSVRLTAQRILYDHLRADTPLLLEPPVKMYGETNADSRYWGELAVDLTGATLINWEFSHVRAGRASFENAKFVGDAKFYSAMFIDEAIFNNAIFHGGAYFFQACFGGRAEFQDSTFRFRVNFDCSVFLGSAYFHGANFWTNAPFAKVAFHSAVSFDRATFVQSPDFTSARFAESALHFRPEWPHGWKLDSTALSDPEEDDPDETWRMLYFDDSM